MLFQLETMKPDKYGHSFMLMESDFDLFFVVVAVFKFSLLLLFLALLWCYPATIMEG